MSSLCQIKEILREDPLREIFTNEYLKKNNPYLCNYVEVWKKAKSNDPNILNSLSDMLLELDDFDLNELEELKRTYDNDRVKNEIVEICENKLSTQLANFKNYLHYNHTKS